MLTKSAVSFASFVLVVAPTGTLVQPTPRFDLIVRHGTVIDGSGGAPYRADVGVVDGRIAALGNLNTSSATTELDARGLMVAPGFINLHSHAEPRGLQTADNMLSQGVTTEILNADGSGPLDIRQQLHVLDSAGLALNVGAAIGFNSIWSQTMGVADRRPTPENMARMQQLVATNLEYGAFAVSAGLDYKPAFFATEQEVVQVLAPAKRWRTNFPNHDRVVPETRFSARAAVRETMRIGEAAGLVPVITHMKVSGRERTHGRIVLGEMTAYSARGVYTAADVYPYLSGMTGLHALTVPGWAQDGGPAAMRKRFADPALRQRIITEINETVSGRFTGPEGVLVLSTRRYLSDYMKEFGVASAGEAIVKILETDLPSAILGFGDESDLVRILQHPSAAVSCDCGATVGATGHPRNFGTFPRVLGRYVREQRHLTWANAVRKMTALPATIAGMVDRGYLAVGMYADITVFDSATVIDHATFEQPGLRSEGVRHVVVNGNVAYKDGQSTQIRAGQALYRGSWMPSRSMTSATGPRRLVANGLAVPLGDSGVPLNLRLTVQQALGANAATGSFRLTDAAGNLVLEATAFGTVQTATRWGSLTGLARRDSSDARVAFTVTVERADPFVRGTPHTITLDVPGWGVTRALVK